MRDQRGVSERERERERAPLCDGGTEAARSLEKCPGFVDEVKSESLSIVHTSLWTNSWTVRSTFCDGITFACLVSSRGVQHGVLLGSLGM